MTPTDFSRALVRLDEELSTDLDVARELFPKLLALQKASGLLHGDRPICPFLRPYFLPRSRYDEIATAAETLAAAFETVARRALEDDELMQVLALTETERRWARVDPGYDRLCITSRLDSFLTTDGFKFLEYNAESPAGLADQMLLERVLLQVPQVRAFLERFPTTLPEPQDRLLGALLDGYRAWGGKREYPRIAIVDWRGVPTESEFRVLKDYFDERGYPTVIADPGDLEYDGSTLHVGGDAIDILYKRVIIHEFLERSDDSHPLLRAYADGRIYMANSFRAKIVHKKASLAILSDPSYVHLFTPEQREVIARHIPWTRVVRRGRVDWEGRELEMRDLLESERARLVLKPNDSYGGEGVVVGSDADAAVWERTIDRAFDEPYVVQARVPIRHEHMPVYEDGRIEIQDLTVDFDPFLFNNDAWGGLVRLSATVLSNVSSGGGETALAIVEDE